MMKKRVLCWCMLVVIGLGMAGGLSGCESQRNAETGVTETRVNPAVAEEVLTWGDVAGGVLTALSIWWPCLLPIAGYVGGSVRVGRKLKPQLTTYKGEAAAYYKATSAVVAAIEELKKDNPEEWQKLKAKLYNTVGPNAEALIRALRGLPPVE